MIGTVIFYYLAVLLQTGNAAAPAAKRAGKAPAPAAPTAGLVFETERRDRAPAVTPTQSIGSLIVATAGGTQVATAPTADDVVEAVQKFYKDIQQVTASFRQKVTNATFGRSTTTDGRVLIKKPGKMRWDYYGKKKGKDKKPSVTKSFISNGDYLYVVDRQNKQVIEKNLEDNMLPVAVTFLYGKGDLAADFTAKLDTSKKYAGKDDISLELTPKVQTTQYKTLYLVVDKTTFRVKQSVIIDGSGNVNHFYFYTPNFDKAVKDSLFLFDKKSVPDYRIVADDDVDDAPAKKTK